MEANELKQFPLLAEMFDEDREMLCEVLEERKLPNKRTLFRESTEADGMYLVCSGSIAITCSRSDEVLSVGPGQVLGGMSLVVVGPREITAKVENGPAVVLFLPRTSFRRVMDDAPRAAVRLLESLLMEAATAARELLPAAGNPWESQGS